MKRMAILLGWAMSVATMAFANEPAEQGVRPAQPVRMGRGERMEGGGEMLLRPMVIKQLALSSEQQSQIAAIVGAASNETSTLRSKMQSLAQKQAELMGPETVDEAAVLQLADEIGKVRSDLAKIQIKQMLAARKILTSDQRLKMREMMKNFMAKNESRRPGGGKIQKGENKHAGAPPPNAAPDTPAPPPPLPKAE